MKTLLIPILIIGLLSSCSSGELVENWKNPDIDTFEAQKVLVVGITADLSNRKAFEDKLTSSLKKNGVNAIKSLDFFGKLYSDSPKTEEELLELETEMIQEGFDAILLSKVVGVEDKVTVVTAVRNMDRTFRRFREDYYESQEIYYDQDYYEEFQIFHAQSTLYCICPEKERETIWQGSIDITEPESVRKAINDYVRILVWALKEQHLLIFEEEIYYEDIDI